MPPRFLPLAATTLLAGLLACGEAPEAESHVASVADVGPTFMVRDTTIRDVIEAPARIEPLLATTMGTKLMAHVVTVNVREGDRVSSGSVLVQLDARDVQAKRDQASAALRSAEAARHEAELYATRMRALFADSAAPRAQLDGAEASLARAREGVAAARGGIDEIEALVEQATVRAPFTGIVAQRFVDEGAFVAPGSPLLRIEDVSRLRIVAGVPPASAANLARSATVDVRIEGVLTSGTVEGIVPATGAALVLVQVLVDNPQARFSSGSAATIAIPAGERRALLVPAGALVKTGDLTGVRRLSGGTVTTRWIRAGRQFGEWTEILSGIAPGDTLVMPAEPVGA